MDWERLCGRSLPVYTGREISILSGITGCAQPQTEALTFMQFSAVKVRAVLSDYAPALSNWEL